MVADNVQTAVDDEHGLIVHHAVTNDTSDNRQLQPMAEATQTVLGCEQLTVLADAGYSNGAQFASCEQLGINALVPVNRSVNNHWNGALYSKAEFSYDPDTDR